MATSDPQADQKFDALLLEQRRGWEERTPLRVEELLVQHPELRNRQDALLDLINHEIVLRCEFDVAPSREEYFERFPNLKPDLAMLFDVQDAIAADTSANEGENGKPAADISSGDTDYATIVRHAASALVRDIPSVPNYQVIEKLGIGGMGVVYKAFDLRLKRTVALKMIRAGHAGDEERRRFQTEAEAVAKLDHPLIVHIYDIGDQEDQPFLALEYVDGGSLADLLKGIPQPPETAARLIELLARAVHYAHSLGVIHRDLKPANILLQKIGDSPSQLGDASHWTLGGYAYLPKIADFGLAKHVQNNSDATQTQAIIGTPSYMAPEQAGDFNRRVGPPADVYSLGAILYEMITGRPPFRGETVLDTLDQLRSQEPVSPKRLQPKVPHDLETICLKCLRKDPKQRYPNAGELADDLARYLHREPIRARPPSVLQYLVLWCRRRPEIAVLLTALISLTLFGIFALTILWQRAAAGEELGKAQFYDSRINIGQRHWREMQCKRLRWFLERLKPAAGEKDRREFEWYYLEGLLNQDLARLTADRGLAYSADGALLAAGVKHDIFLWKPLDFETNRQAGPIAKLEGHAGDIVSIAFSSRGDRLLSAATDRTVRLWDVAARATIKSLSTHPADVTAVAMSADGTMASSCQDGIVRVWNADGTLRRELKEHTGAVNDIAFTPDGRRLVSGGADTWVIVWDIATGAILRKMQDHGGVMTVAAAPNGKWVASSGLDRELRVWDIDRGVLVQRFPALPQPVTSLAFRADSNRLACACRDSAIRIWNMVPVPKKYADQAMFAREPMFVLKGHFDAVERVAFAPAGDRLASLSRDHEMRLWDPNRNQEARTFDLPMDASGMARDPRGPWVAVAGRSKDIHLWNWRTEEEKIMNGDDSAVSAVAFADDGTLASGGQDGSLRVWNIEQGTLIRKLPSTGAPIVTMAFHPGCHRLVTAASDGVIRFWEAAGGCQLYQGPPQKGVVNHLIYDPTGRWLAAAATNGPDTKDGVVSVCDADTGEAVCRFTDPYRTPRTLAFSADGSLLAAGDEQFTIRVWNMRSHQRLLQLEGHEAPVLAVAFSHNGHRLASASKDGVVKLWDVATGLELLTLRGYSADANGVFFVEDDTMLISLGRTPAVPAQIRLWDSTAGRK